MSANIEAGDIIRALKAAMGAAGDSMQAASKELDRRNRHIEQLIAALEDIAAIAEDRFKYEDLAVANLGAILIICQKNLGIIT